MKFKATTGWAISGWLVTIILLVFMVINSFDTADSLNALLGKTLYPLVGESSKGIAAFLIITVGIAILSVGFIGGIVVTQIKHANHLSKFNGLYILRNKAGGEEVLHIIYIWNKPPLLLNGYKQKMIYCQYHRSSLHTKKKGVNSFLYGLFCRTDSNDPNNANHAALYGEENGLKLLIELEKDNDDSRYSKITLDLITKDQYDHIPEVKWEKRKGVDSLFGLRDEDFNDRFKEIVSKIIAEEWWEESVKLPEAIHMSIMVSASQKGDK